MPTVEHDLPTETLAVTYTDTGRPVPETDKAPARPERRIDTTIVHPVAGQGRGTGPFPVLVLAHGLNGYPERLIPFAEILASHGYVVLVPRFPASAHDAPGGASVGDLAEQPGDVSFVLDRFLGDPPAPVAGMLDRTRIGAAGHSLGGDTVLADASHPRHRDRRIRAAAILSGVNIDFAGGPLLSADPPPLLFVQGDADTLLGPGTRSSELYPVAPPPKFLLTIHGAGHSSPYESTGPAEQRRLTATAVADFFDRYLKGDRSALGRLDRLVAGSDGLGKLEADPG